MNPDPVALGAPTVSGARPVVHRLLNRERSILEFNRRVLAQAERADVPELERLRYITIVSSNLDEFFEVRFADLVEASLQPGMEGAMPVFDEVSLEAHRLIAAQYDLFNRSVMPALERLGIDLIGHGQRDAAQRQWVARFYRQQVRPLLVPIGLDPAHPFPQVANKSLNFIVQLSGLDAFGHENTIAIVKVPRVLPRVIALPPELTDGRHGFVLLSSIIRAHLAELFPGRTVESFSQFRLTRDSDLEVDEDDMTNLRQALRSGLTQRHYGRAIRLEVVESCPEALSSFLLDQFALPAPALYRVDGPVNLVRLNQLIDQAAQHRELARLRFPSFWPSQSLVDLDSTIMDRLKQGDLLLHHPFESFDPVVRFLREAVQDPAVLSIKLTVYRTGVESVLMDLLIEAVRVGKEVLAVVELKARFDEEANINWAERLESVGAQVVYGIVGLKTHAKMMIVTRREPTEGGARVLRRYLHLSTGNYNPATARQYTDLGHFTADARLAADADALFVQLSSQARSRPPRHLVVAPFALHRRMLDHIAEVAAAARAGRAARIVLKINGLTDEALIRALADASTAGADIDLVVRGACMLPPGVPGFTERIRVRSIVGRFLEHSRILYFRWGPDDDDQVLYLSSADWMGRNMHRRVEVAWPIRDRALRQRIIDECLVPYLHDRRDAWSLGPDGSYRRVADDGISAQQALIAWFEQHREPS